MTKVFVGKHRKNRTYEIFVVKEMTDQYFVADHYFTNTYCTHDCHANVSATTNKIFDKTVKKNYKIEILPGCTPPTPYIDVRGYSLFKEYDSIESAVNAINELEKSSYYYFITR